MHIRPAHAGDGNNSIEVDECQHSSSPTTKVGTVGINSKEQDMLQRKLEHDNLTISIHNCFHWKDRCRY